MIEAYVEGRPIPRFSNSLTKDASLKRATGLVKCCFGSNCCNASTSPGLRSGKSKSSSPLRLTWGWTRVQPSNFNTRPLAVNSYSPALTRNVVESYLAGNIWHANVWRQISSYKRWASRSISPNEAAVSLTFEGRIASWASWAPSFAP